jgi:hypothetical protein
MTSDQTGSGIAIEIESTVMARQTDSPQIASEAATAWISRNEATGAAPPSKPIAPRDRIMAEFPGTRGRITRTAAGLCSRRWQYCGGPRPENGKIVKRC